MKAFRDPRCPLEKARTVKLSLSACLLIAFASISFLIPSPSPAQPAGDEAYQALLKREFGTAIKEMEAIEKEIQGAKPADYPEIEKRLLTVVESSEATMPGKQFACQMLRIVGSSKCVPAMAKLLADDKLSHMARSVLIEMHDPAVEEVLRKALAQTDGKLRIGIINTIGDRKDRSSVRAIAAFLQGDDEATVRSALNAVGKIGTAQAADTLKRFSESRKPAWAQEAWAHAYLRCADEMTAAGEPGQTIYEELFTHEEYPAAVRAGALSHLPDTPAPRIIALLFSDDPIMARAAASAIISVPGNGKTKEFVRELLLPSTPAKNKAVLLDVLAIRGDAQGITDSVNKLAGDQDPAVRQAAIKSLARLGSADSIPLLTAALKEGGTIASDANKSLVELQGDGVVPALIKQSETGDVAVRAATFKVLADRGEAEALPVFRRAIKDPYEKIRRAGFKTLAALGTQEDMTMLVAMLLAEKDDSERRQIAGALSDIGARMTDTSARSEPILKAIPTADPPAKASLFSVLSSLGGDKSLQAVRAALAEEGEVRKAAVRALADWPDLSPMPDLLGVAKDGKDKAEQIVALRGYIRLAGLPAARGKVQFYREAMEAATRPEEKWLVLAGLANVAQPEALKVVEPCLEDPKLQREAFAAYEKIGESLAGRQPSTAKEALQRVADNASDTALRNKAKAALDKLSTKGN